MKSISSDVWLAFCVMALAAAYLYMDMRLPEVRLSDPLGPRAFPALVGVGLIASALVILLEGRGKVHSKMAEPVCAQTSAQTAADTKNPHAEQTAPEPKQRPFVLIGMVVWTAVYYLCFERAGYVLSTSVFLFGLLSYFNRRRHKTNLAIALGVTVVFDLLFSQLLGVPVPTGLLPF
ncbi:tripartite tricarboxylate transporter TctB family protein [Paraburkholderia xenovorans LB400]|jgi:putative tricarboxylic transport membrane protein|uniref:Tricarboxylic transporter, TctB (4TM)subunit n=1 Tax=Paraburkholderia xenovorans (strain LB400) TaxID=266265 RepID=Q13YC0_PARXL|nr:tripartite tricarboxylate transporter TctB family protein [Paraburkholderia xenovorans]ABE30919.1 Putative tricarboxylic transporter, TctB (4TM)subunit [Paraburkholderia xenovorans LB400]AIP33069.1 tripartite tricarboxylate transporter TctB family protein [Paraburkholderia xenovorans LB400]NPT39416.1 tripartite tricarboxylate transporter TctB family protein [Paraburkholderia xenovorans]